MNTIPLERQLVYTEKKNLEECLAMSPLIEKLLDAYLMDDSSYVGTIPPHIHVYLNEAFYWATCIMKNSYPAEINPIELDMRINQLALYIYKRHHLSYPVMEVLYGILSLDNRAKEHCQYFLHRLKEHLELGEQYSLFIAEELAAGNTYDIDLSPHPVPPEALMATPKEIVEYANNFSTDKLKEMVYAYPQEMRKSMIARLEHVYKNYMKIHYDCEFDFIQFFNRLRAQLDNPTQDTTAAPHDDHSATAKLEQRIDELKQKISELTAENERLKADLDELSNDDKTEADEGRFTILEVCLLAAEILNLDIERKKINDDIPNNKLNQTEFHKFVAALTGCKPESVKKKIRKIDYDKQTIIDSIAKLESMVKKINPRCNLAKNLASFY